MTAAPAIVVLNRFALETAMRLVEALPGATLHCGSDEVFRQAGEAPLPLAGEGGARRSSSDGGRVRGLCPGRSVNPIRHSGGENQVNHTNNFSLQEDLIHKIDQVPSHLRNLYQQGTPILAICAAGIVIRALAPVLADKRAEPPVLAVAPDGSAVIPLLGGHHGANDLARQVGAVLRVAPAITTASDLAFGVALDDPPPGWRLANPQHLKPFMAALLDGGTVRLAGSAPWLEKSGLPFADHAPLEILVTTEAAAGSETRLVLHPQSVALGVGCERGAEPAELTSLVTRTLVEAKLSPLAIAGVFSVDLKADEPAVHALADHLGVPARFFDAATLEALTPRLANPSDLVFREVGCHGVAEAAALAAAGDTATLFVEKRKSARATCALAAAPAPFDARPVGRPQGWLAIVGLGPGSPDWRTPEAERLLRQASDLVGHDLYLDFLGDLSAGKTLHSSPMGEEEARARLALDLAAAGRQVVLVSSGDPGVYAMATLVFALLETDGREAWRRLPIQVAPGVTALHAAAARVGAPTGHDFCAISLSDLLTPWEVIARRVEAAAATDFVIGFFNPVSRRRDWQLDRARDILLKHRTKETPVILARAVGREEESVRVIPLADLSADKADMLTIVIVGASTTRTVPREGGVWVYTPRGYDCEPKP